MFCYTIYKNPFDFPGDWVVKKWDCSIDPPKQDLGFIRVEKLLEKARSHIPAGLYNFGRRPDDDAVIYESWM